MPVILGPKYWWNHFKKLFGLGDHTKGGMTLGHGWHEVFVPTSCSPKNVKLYVQYSGVPCCGGEVCLTGTCLRPDGFVLYADVRTDTAEVQWIIEYIESCPQQPDIFG